MLVTTKNWMARRDESDRIIVEQKRCAVLTEDLLGELESMRKLCFPGYDLSIEANDGEVVCAFVRSAADSDAKMAQGLKLSR